MFSNKNSPFLKNRFSGISFHFQIYFVYRESIFIGTQFNVSCFTEELFTENCNGTDTGNTEVNELSVPMDSSSDE